MLSHTRPSLRLLRQRRSRRRFQSVQEHATSGANVSVVYNTLLDSCIRHGRMDLVDVVLADTQRLKVVSSYFTLDIVVKLYGRRKQLAKAFEAFEGDPEAPRLLREPAGAKPSGLRVHQQRRHRQGRGNLQMS